MLCLGQVCSIIHRWVSLVHCHWGRMKQILTLRCMYLTVNVINNKSKAFFTDEDMYEHSSRSVPPSTAAFPRQFELRIVWLCMECQLQTLKGLSVVSGFSTGRSTVTCQALREFRQLIGNQTHQQTWAHTILGDQICESAWVVDMNDADRRRARVRACVLTECTPFSIHNITLWSSCGTSASPISSSDPLETHESFFACLIALRKFTLLATSPIAACCASIEYNISMVLFLCVGAVNCTLATFCWIFTPSSCLSFLVHVYVETFNKIKQTIG